MERSENPENFNLVVREWRKTIPQDYPDVAFCILHALGQIHYDEGHYKDALNCFLQELPMRRSMLGTYHISVSHVLVAIASIMYLSEDGNQATSYLKEAINIVTFHQYRSKHATSLMIESNQIIWNRLADTLYDIGNRHFVDGNILVATQFYKAAVKASLQPTLDERRFKKNQADEINRAVQESIDNYLSSASQKMINVRVKDAFEIHRGRTSVCDKTSISMLSIMGHFFSSQGRTDEALDTYVTVLNLRRACLGKNHPTIADTLTDIAFVARESGKFQAASSAYNEAIHFYKRIGKAKVSLVRTIANKGDMQYQMGEFDASLISYVQALRLCQKYSMGEVIIEDMRYRVALIRYKHFQNDRLYSTQALGEIFELCKHCDFDLEWLDLYNECIEHMLSAISETIALIKIQLPR